MAAPYSFDMGLALFAAQFGWSREQYEAITPVQRAFIVKEWERKTVADSDLLKAAVEVALGNAFRKRGQNPRPLWRTRRPSAPAVTKREAESLGAAIAARPWVPWQKGGSDG